MSPNVEIRIEFARVVWRTRGVAWDYTFICTPDENDDKFSGRWYDLLGEAFPSMSSTDVHEPVAGTIDDTLRFIAARVVDPIARDSSGRPIWHEFLVTGVERAPKGLPNMWGTQFLDRLHDLLPEFLALLARDKPDDLRAAFSNLRHDRPHVTISGPGADVPTRNLGTARHPFTTYMVLVLVVCALLAVALR